jgi:serine O-acetyltransferase
MKAKMSKQTQHNKNTTDFGCCEPKWRFWRDAVELTRGMIGEVTAKDVLRTALTQDTYLITTLQGLRVWTLRWRIPFVNTVLRRLQTVLFGAEIGDNVSLGLGVCFLHPIGVVVGGDTVVGDRVKFFGSNTLGTAKENGYPTIEADVVLGAGARVLGPVRVGARSQIGANAVVLTDIPPDSVAVGIPARVLSVSIGKEAASTAWGLEPGRHAPGDHA